MRAGHSMLCPYEETATAKAKALISRTAASPSTQKRRAGDAGAMRLWRSKTKQSANREIGVPRANLLIGAAPEFF